MTRWSRLAIVALLLAAAALAACSGGGDGDAEEAQATPAADFTITVGKASTTTTAPTDPTPTTAPTATPTLTVKTTYTLTLATATNGRLSKSPAKDSYTSGERVTVTATRFADYELSVWGGACAATSPESATCTLTMDGDKTVSATFGKVAALPTAAPVLLAVTTGNRGEVLLEWTPGGDTAGVTRWQYRLRLQREGLKPWGAWTDVPGSGAATRSHRVRGLGLAVHYWQLRAVAGAVEGSASETVEGSPAVIGAGGIPRMLPGDVIEGGRAWQIGGGAVIDVPAGTRLRYVGFGYSDGETVVIFEDGASDWWQGVNTTTLTGAGRGQRAPAADAARAAQASEGGRDVPAILDSILNSLRREPEGSK